MTGLVLRRLIQLPLILLVIYTVTFALAWLMPGDPLEQDEARQPPAEVARAMREQYNLDSPWTFYWDYLANATGIGWAMGRTERVIDLGPSLRHPNWSVNEILAAGLPVSVTLGTIALLLALVIGLVAGAIGGVRPGGWCDFATLMIALIGISLPTFVIGAALLVLCAVWLNLAPIGGWGTLGHLVLPSITLSLPFAAYIARLTRFGMIEQMSQDYIRTARAKGLPEYRVVLKHALKNAFLPVLSYLGPAAAAALTGSFVVEVVFAVPGIGVHFVDAVLSKDLTLIMGVTLVYSAMLIAFNLAVDVLYAWVDPRIEATGA